MGPGGRQDLRGCQLQKAGGRFKLNVSGGRQELMRCWGPGGRQEIGGHKEPTGRRLWDLLASESAFGAQRGGGEGGYGPAPSPP